MANAAFFAFGIHRGSSNRPKSRLPAKLYSKQTGLCSKRHECSALTTRPASTKCGWAGRAAWHTISLAALLDDWFTRRNSSFGSGWDSAKMNGFWPIFGFHRLKVPGKVPGRWQVEKPLENSKTQKVCPG